MAGGATIGRVRSQVVAVYAVTVALLMGVATVTGASEAASPDRLVRRFLRVEISPNGALVASVEGQAPVNSDDPPLRELVIREVRKDNATSIPMPCGLVPQCWPGYPTWSADSRHLSFTLKRPGSLDYDVYTVDADGSHLTKQISFNGTVVHLRYLPDGRLTMLATRGAVKEVGATQAGAAVAGDLDASSPEQRIAILDHGSLQWASPPDLFVYEYDWRADGKGFIGTAAPGDGDNNWWTAKLYTFGSDGTAQVLYAPSDMQQQITAPRVSRDGRTVAFIAGLMSDFGATGGEVYSIALAGGQPTNITPAMPASATSLLWSCKNHLLAEELAGDHRQLVDLGDGRQPAATRVLWSGAETFARNGESVSLACPSAVAATSHESFTSAPEIQTGSPGKWKDLTASNTGMTFPARVQSLQWRSNAFTVQGWLFLPEQAQGKLPLITIVHGGPASAAVPSFKGPGLDRELLGRGYALFRPNPRGSFGQGEQFTRANVRDFGHGDLSDILAGIDAAEKVAPIDDARLGITGGSYGGFMTMWTVTQTSRFKAAVASAGVSDWLSYYGENGIDAWMLPYFGNSVYNDPAVYARSSPINFIKNVHTPTFSYVGERDIECPAPQTQEFWHALKDLGVPTSVMIYPGEGHHLRDPEHDADAMRRTIEWFDRYLGLPAARR
jgi:dipeptidyl aminopeptidase/acylaminoacyl peptidase